MLHNHKSLIPEKAKYPQSLNTALSYSLYLHFHLIHSGNKRAGFIQLWCRTSLPTLRQLGPTPVLRPLKTEYSSPSQPFLISSFVPPVHPALPFSKASLINTERKPGAVSPQLSYENNFKQVSNTKEMAKWLVKQETIREKSILSLAESKRHRIRAPWGSMSVGMPGEREGRA